jgi:hypothetical protein
MSDTKAPALCKFGMGCFRPDCWFTHPDGWVPAKQAPKPCKYGSSCHGFKSGGCSYTHPPPVETVAQAPKPCKYGSSCHGFKSGGCSYTHPPPVEAVAQAPKPCKYGSSCYGFKSGGCPYTHPPSVAAAQAAPTDELTEQDMENMREIEAMLLDKASETCEACESWSDDEDFAFMDSMAEGDLTPEEEEFMEACIRAQDGKL